jgi:hypothetical protein
MYTRTHVRIYACMYIHVEVCVTGQRLPIYLVHPRRLVGCLLAPTFAWPFGQERWVGGVCINEFMSVCMSVFKHECVDVMGVRLPRHVLHSGRFRQTLPLVRLVGWVNALLLVMVGRCGVGVRYVRIGRVS